MEGKNLEKQLIAHYESELFENKEFDLEPPDDEIIDTKSCRRTGKSL